ncbi:MAG TPA: DUF177 domain-containing protein [Thermodesulfovibrionales bacterium]|nr:DUF177 domain-containing protein [Thermodesulfovibrionales bacterium]
MKIILSEITEEGLDLDFEETLNTAPLRLLSPVKARLRIDKVGSEVLARGELVSDIELQCSRCLSRFSGNIAVDVNVVYHPLEELAGEEKYEIKEDELDTGFYEGDELDIAGLIQEQIMLSVPMKPLCRDSCKGLCSRCGSDLNATTCSCEQKEPDPRLAVLKKLLDEGKE